jgi:hypothetical protein
MYVYSPVLGRNVMRPRLMGASLAVIRTLLTARPHGQLRICLKNIISSSMTTCCHTACRGEPVEALVAGLPLIGRLGEVAASVGDKPEAATGAASSNRERR